MNTKSKKFRILFSIFMSLFYGVIVWGIMNCAKCMEKNMVASLDQLPAWLIPIFAICFFILAHVSKYNPRSITRIPLFIIIFSGVIGTIIGYYIYEVPNPYLGLSLSISISPFVSPIFSPLTRKRLFNSDMRNWKKIHKVSDIKNPTELESLAIKAANWWFNQIPNSTEKNRIDMIQGIVEQDGSYRINDSKRQIRMIVKDDKITIEEYKTQILN